MRVYISAQFADGPHRTRLISVALVSARGEIYRIADDPSAIEHARKDAWLREHVLTYLPYEEDGRDWRWDEDHPDFRLVQPFRAVGDDLLDFIDAHRGAELWGWHAAYSYVAVRHLFGRYTDCPAGFPGWCGELTGEWVKAGRPPLPPRGDRGHQALRMARWAQAAAAVISQAD